VSDFTKNLDLDLAFQGSAFASLRDDLERRSRQWVTTVRVLELQHQHLTAAELERDAAYAQLSQVIPVVEEMAGALKAAMDAYKAGKPTRDLDVLFERNEEAINDLEKAALAVSTHFLACRSAWDQYLQSVESAKRLRAEMLPSGPSIKSVD